MKAILGSWGIGGYLKGKGQDGEIKGGFFDKQRFLTSKQIRKRIHDDPYQIFLPPITKFSNGGIDYLPFILYDKVIMDSGCFETICYKSEIIPPKIREFIGSDVSGILEKLRENEILELKDYRQILDSDEADRDIDENVKYDLQDSNIIEPVANSLENWKEFYQTLLDSCNPHDTESIRKCIDKFNGFSSQIKNNNFTDFNDLYKYAFECVSDINRLFYISNQFDQNDVCTYDWEDYFYFYNYKLKRSWNQSKYKSSGKSFYKLVNLFVPEFKVLSFDHLMEIRENPRLNSFKEYISGQSPNDFSQEMLRNVLFDVLELERKIGGFRKIASWVLMLIPIGGFIPVFGSLIDKAVAEVTDKVIEKRVKKDSLWKFFLTDMEKLYGEHEVKTIAKNIGKQNTAPLDI